MLFWTVFSFAAAASAADCDGHLTASELSSFNDAIANNEVTVFGLPGTPCLDTAVNRLDSKKTCYKKIDLTEKTWAYFTCKYPDEGKEETGRAMHSYVYIGGEAGFVGNGFKFRADVMSDTDLDSKLQAAGAKSDCSNPDHVIPKNHAKLSSCESKLSGGMLSMEELNTMIDDNPVVLLGWVECPCTQIATARFEDVGVCHAHKDWDLPSEPLMVFLQCLYGSDHHSFIFIGQKFIDNGFRFANDKMGKDELDGLLSAADAKTTCGPELPPGEAFFKDFTQLLQNNPGKKNYGVAVTDIDNDGAFEFVVAGFGNANMAYKFDKTSGEFVDIARGKPVLQDADRKAIGVAACDIDGDGYEELYVLNTDQYQGVTTTSDRILLRGEDGSYDDMFEQDKHKGAANFVAGRSVACTDRDGDGVYGMFVANYGGPMKLYELDADQALTDVAPDLGLDKTTGGRALVSAPLVSDHRMDIFANNENGCNFFWRNTGDGYVEEAATLGIADCQETGRGTTVMDANNDGVLDLVYGNWVGPHRMYIQKDGKFVDEVTDSMKKPSKIRTVIAADFDNDGQEELFFNNIPGANRLFTVQDGKWVEINIGDARLSASHGTGGAIGDFDGDGQLELIVSHGESGTEPLGYFRPTAGKDNNWLRVAPQTQHGAPARGATVRLFMGAKEHVRAIDAGSGYLCQMEPVAHFGLGQADKVDKVKITWPSGISKVINGPEINKLHRIPYPAEGEDGVESGDVRRLNNDKDDNVSGGDTTVTDKNSAKSTDNEVEGEDSSGTTQRVGLMGSVGGAVFALSWSFFFLS